MLLASATVSGRGLRKPEVRRDRNAKKAAEYQSDDRQPVLYLRCFDIDDLAAQPDDAVGGNRFDPRVTLDPRTQEEHLAALLSVVGPVHAIGNPNDGGEPPLGVYRTYWGDDWRAEVMRCLRADRLVVLVPGFDLRGAEGFMWELEKTREVVPPERVLILLPYDADGYGTFRADTTMMFPHRLPKFPQPPDRKKAASIFRAVLYFDADWKPTIRPVVRGFGRQSSLLANNDPSEIAAAVAPFFDRLAPGWRRKTALVEAQYFRKALIIMALWLAGLAALGMLSRAGEQPTTPDPPLNVNRQPWAPPSSRLSWHPSAPPLMPSFPSPRLTPFPGQSDLLRCTGPACARMPDYPSAPAVPPSP